MERIIVSVSDLYERAKELKEDGMDYVSLSLLDSDTDTDGDPIPACIFVSAISKDDNFMAVDYDEIEAAPENINF